MTFTCKTRKRKNNQTPAPAYCLRIVYRGPTIRRLCTTTPSDCTFPKKKVLNTTDVANEDDKWEASTVHLHVVVMDLQHDVGNVCYK